MIEGLMAVALCFAFLAALGWVADMFLASRRR